MKGPNLRKAALAGLERVAAWSSLLDLINVFPVADGDTGRNLIISLAPLRRFQASPEKNAMETGRELLLSARGNSGNIATRFCHAFIQADTLEKLPHALRTGRDQARKAISDPQPGTMLTFFDSLAEFFILPPSTPDACWARGIVANLAEVVKGTTALQPRLEQAGVVDSGALGMFLFFQGFLNAVTGQQAGLCDVAALFPDRLRVRKSSGRVQQGYCVDTVFSSRKGMSTGISELQGLGESLVVIQEDEFTKVHLHTANPEGARRSIERFGNVLRWSEDDLEKQTAAELNPLTGQAVHVMTDAAGSLTREQARQLGITLLNSYINLGEDSLPESCLSPGILYKAMREEVPVSTSQASVDERYQSYQSVQSLYGKVLYLSVGSFYTGNYETAVKWKTESDPKDEFTVMDTGCAGGRLGLLAAITARFAGQTDDTGQVIAFARRAVNHCREYIFIDKLQYLAAGGRMSRTGAFFGDAIGLKPVISPQPDGARKVKMVRNRRDQVTFALKRLSEYVRPKSHTDIWLEYTDNREFLIDYVRPAIEKSYPQADILVKPLSLTTGAHTGPGSWGIAFYEM